MILFTVGFLASMCILVYNENGDEKFLISVIVIIAFVVMAADSLLFW